MRRPTKFLAAAAIAALPSFAGAQAIRVAGFGQGCYYLIGGPLCTNFTTTASSSSVLVGSSLVYHGGSSASHNFDSFTSDGFIGIGGTPDNFGTLTTNTVNFNYGTATPKLGFRLLVSFEQPTGIVGVLPVNAIITGSTSTRAGGSGGVFYDFVNTSQGPFAFSASEAPGVNPGDPNVPGGAGNLLTFAVNDMSVLHAQTASVTGNVTLEVTTPEPASIALVTTGLLGLVGFGVARRRTA